MEVGWTSMPPNGCAADRRTPGGKRGGGDEYQREMQQKIFPLPLTPSREGRGEVILR